jgi:hypothetical protein
LTNYNTYVLILINMNHEQTPSENPNQIAHNIDEYYANSAYWQFMQDGNREARYTVPDTIARVTEDDLQVIQDYANQGHGDALVNVREQTKPSSQKTTWEQMFPDRAVQPQSERRTDPLDKTRVFDGNEIKKQIDAMRAKRLKEHAVRVQENGRYSPSPVETANERPQRVSKMLGRMAANKAVSIGSNIKDRIVYGKRRSEPRHPKNSNYTRR